MPTSYWKSTLNTVLGTCTCVTAIGAVPTYRLSSLTTHRLSSLPTHRLISLSALSFRTAPAAMPRPYPDEQPPLREVSLATFVSDATQWLNNFDARSAEDPQYSYDTIEDARALRRFLRPVLAGCPADEDGNGEVGR